MLQEREDAAVKEAGFTYNKSSLIVVAVCVTLSMIFMKTGFLSFFFLVPLGYAVLVSGSLWLIFIAAASVNIVISVLLHLFAANNSSLWMDILYFSAVILLFLWIVSGKNIRTAYRFILASAGGAIAFIIFIWSNRSGTSFNVLLNEMAQLLSSIFVSSSGNQTAVQQVFTPERVLELMTSIVLRGGALVSMFFVFFLNRQITLSVARFFRRQINTFGLIDFFTPSNTVWVFSGALAVVLVTRLLRVEILEIISWNVLTVCVIMFWAQGAGILMYLLAKRPPVFRIIISVIIVVLIFSPLSTIALVALLLLGIIENWLPLRGRRVEKKETINHG
jgi:hypothetical protein